MEIFLDSLHTKVKQIRFLHYFALFNRLILAVAFFPSGMTKLLGNRFTMLPIDNPVGFFFESFYQAHGWYRFVGFAQVLASILLLFPRTATLGATIFLPIVLNIMLITWSIDFRGTKYITALMFLANLFLICWDYDKFKRILPFSSGEKKPFIFRFSIIFIILGAIGGAMTFSFFMMVNKSFAGFGVLGIIIGAIGGGVIGLLNSWQLQTE